MTAEERQDRSREGILSKGLVLLQIGRFVIQAIARKAEGFVLTELEVVAITSGSERFRAVAAGFGATISWPWSYPFPSQGKRVLWRVSIASFAVSFTSTSLRWSHTGVMTSRANLAKDRPTRLNDLENPLL